MQQQQPVQQQPYMHGVRVDSRYTGNMPLADVLHAQQQQMMQSGAQHLMLSGGQGSQQPMQQSGQGYQPVAHMPSFAQPTPTVMLTPQRRQTAAASFNGQHQVQSIFDQQPAPQAPTPSQSALTQILMTPLAQWPQAANQFAPGPQQQPQFQAGGAHQWQPQYVPQPQYAPMDMEQQQQQYYAQEPQQQPSPPPPAQQQQPFGPPAVVGGAGGDGQAAQQGGGGPPPPPPPPPPAAGPAAAAAPVAAPGPPAPAAGPVVDPTVKLLIDYLMQQQALQQRQASSQASALSASSAHRDPARIDMKSAAPTLKDDSVASYKLWMRELFARLDVMGCAALIQRGLPIDSSLMQVIASDPKVADGSYSIFDYIDVQSQRGVPMPLISEDERKFFSYVYSLLVSGCKQIASVYQIVLAVPRPDVGEILRRLAIKYDQRSLLDVQVLRTQFERMHQLVGESVATYSSRFERIVNDFTAIGEPMAVGQQVSKFLMGLRLPPGADKAILFVNQSFDSLSKAVSLARQLEQVHSSSKQSASSSAATASGLSAEAAATTKAKSKAGAAQSGPTCYNCQQRGHKASECTNPRVEREKAKRPKVTSAAKKQAAAAAKAAKGTCGWCGIVGHTESECRAKRAGKASAVDPSKKSISHDKEKHSMAHADGADSSSDHDADDDDSYADGDYASASFAEVELLTTPSPQSSPVSSDASMQSLDTPPILLSSIEQSVEQGVAALSLADSQPQQQPQPLPCAWCGLPASSHGSSECSVREYVRTLSRQCYHCQATDHHPWRCPVRWPILTAMRAAAEGAAVSNVTAESLHAVQDPTATYCNERGETTALIDSGASHHMFGLGINLRHARSDSDIAIRVASGTRLHHPLHGELTLRSDKHAAVHLKDVLQHPALRQNLLSTDQLLKQVPGASRWEMDLQEARLISTSGGVLLRAPKVGRFYVHTFKCDSSAVPEAQDFGVTQTSAASAASVPELQRIWHRRFGHLGATKLIQLVTSDAAAGIDRMRPVARSDCLDCEHAKLTFKPHSKAVDPALLAKKPLQRLHADLIGRVTPAGINDEEYVLVVIDEYSSFIWAFAICSKDHTAVCLITLMRQLRNNTPDSVKELHTDNGGEFRSAELKEELVMLGVKHTFTLPYEHEHAGKVERANRSIEEMARTMIVASGAPQVLWPLAVYAAVHTLNRVVVIGSTGKTAYELMYGDKADVSHLRPFGCDAVMPSQGVHVGKFEAKASTVAFVGYVIPTGYSFILPAGNLKPVQSRNAKFHESSFTAMQRIAGELQRTELGDEQKVSDFQFYSELGDHNELELAKLISLQELEQDAQQRADVSAPPPLLPDDEDMRSEMQPAAQPLSEEQQQGLRRSSRVTRAAHRYGLVHEGDLGAFSASVRELTPEEIDGAESMVADITQRVLEDWQHVLAAAAGAADPRFPLRAAKIAEARRVAERDAALKRVTQNQLLPRGRPKPDAHGEIITKTQRCVADNARGVQCKARTKHGAYCWLHLKSLFGLRMANSAIPHAGKGLFYVGKKDPATGQLLDLPAGAKISNYTGDMVTAAHPGRFGESAYIIQVTKDISIDAAPRNTAPARLINDCTGTGFRPNCRFSYNPRTKTVSIAATRRIHPGDELYVPYGRDYWREHLKLVKKKQAAAAAAKKKAFYLRGAVRAAAHNVAYCYASSVAKSQPQKKLTPTMGPPPILPDPVSYDEAMQHPFKEQWLAGIAEEQRSLRRNNVYTVVDKLPPGAKIMGSKMVFKTKMDERGDPSRFKVRIVAQGFSQREGIDYDETTSPTVATASLRILLAIACAFDLEVGLIDVVTAYLQADLDRELFIHTPRGFIGPEAGKILRLQKALYGTKQGGRLWNHQLSARLAEIGYHSCEQSDQCVWVKLSKTGRRIAIAVYVDDMPYIYHKHDAEEMFADISKLKSVIELKDMGELKHVLGMRITRNRDNLSLKIDQEVYLTAVLARYGHSQCRSASTPSLKERADAEADRQQQQHEKADVDESAHPQLTLANFSSVVGSLNYAATCTRPDLSYSVGMLSREMAKPDSLSLQKVERVMRYVRGAIQEGLTYSGKGADPFSLVAYSDSDFAGDYSSARSTTGNVVFFAGAAVVWQSKRQATVANSSSEAEYTAAGECAKLIMGCRNFLAEVYLPQHAPTRLFVDNQTAQLWINSESITSYRRKHINVRHHYIRELVKNKEIIVDWVSTKDQIADILTKSMPAVTFNALRASILGSEA